MTKRIISGLDKTHPAHNAPDSIDGPHRRAAMESVRDNPISLRDLKDAKSAAVLEAIVCILLCDPHLHEDTRSRSRLRDLFDCPDTAAKYHSQVFKNRTANGRNVLKPTHGGDLNLVKRVERIESELLTIREITGDL